MAEKTMYYIPGRPVPLARPRFNGTKVYDSQRAEKEYARTYLRQQFRGPMLTGALQLNAYFYFQTPRNKPALCGQPHIMRPDLDNCVKYICDVIQGIMIEDDAVIAAIYAFKLYGPKAQTQFILKPIGNHEK